MNNKFDYNSDDVMKILNNPEYSDEQKKELFETYKKDLKTRRKNEIALRLNECAKENPIITEDDYVNMMKKYSDDDLSKPFDIIEGEIASFSENMKRKYQEYLISEQPKEGQIEESNNDFEEVIEQVQEEDFIEESPMLEDTLIVPTVNITGTENILPMEESIIEEAQEVNEKPIFEENNTKEVLPEELDDNNERGNASAMIISIIAIIIGIVIMYSIIKLK